MTKTKLRPPIKIHGGKWYGWPWVVSHFPGDYRQRTYCELCCGGCSVLLNKDRSENEVINDIDRGVVSIFKTLRDEPKEFLSRLRAKKYTRATFEAAKERAKDEFEDFVDLAVNEFVLRRMSRGGMKKAFAWSDRLRGGKPGDVNAWRTMLSLLPRIAERLKGVTILHGDFLQMAKVWDDDNTLIYLDPPYLPETRTSTQVYEHEMSLEDHVKLLTFAKDARGQVIISGYPSPLYNKYLTGWKTARKSMANHAGQQATKQRRVECLWYNYDRPSTA